MDLTKRGVKATQNTIFSLSMASPGTAIAWSLARLKGLAHSPGEACKHGQALVTAQSYVLSSTMQEELSPDMCI